jgi:hypothetical protein
MNKLLRSMLDLVSGFLFFCFLCLVAGQLNLRQHAANANFSYFLLFSIIPAALSVFWGGVRIATSFPDTVRKLLFTKSGTLSPTKLLFWAFLVVGPFLAILTKILSLFIGA